MKAAGDLSEMAFGCFICDVPAKPAAPHPRSLIIFTTKEAQMLEPPFVSLRKHWCDLTMMGSVFS